MPTIAIINIETLNIEHMYVSPAPDQSRFGGPWGWPSHTVHIEIPDALDRDIVRVVKSIDLTGSSGSSNVTYAFVTDEAKQAAKLVQKWQQVRQLRNEKLKESDWTQFPDVPLPETQKMAWQSYRQALRDFPGTLTDAQVLAANSAEAFEWPVL